MNPLTLIYIRIGLLLITLAHLAITGAALIKLNDMHLALFGMSGAFIFSNLDNFIHTYSLKRELNHVSEMNCTLSKRIRTND